MSLAEPQSRNQPKGAEEAPASLPQPQASEAPKGHHQQHSCFQAGQMRGVGLLRGTRLVDELCVNDEIWPEGCWGVITGLLNACMKGICISVWESTDCVVSQEHPNEQRCSLVVGAQRPPQMETLQSPPRNPYKIPN